MFTGIITEIGAVRALESSGGNTMLTIEAPRSAPGLGIGQSIAVAGVCLTATRIDGPAIALDVMPETLRATRLGLLAPGDRVNLEPALAAGGRLDGHLVQGHVDGVATLASRNPGPAWDDLVFTVDPALARYVAAKGSIAIDGVSLTVTTVADGDRESQFGVSLIPTTLRETTLGSLGPGDPVNIEVDVIAKYVERLLGKEQGR